MGQFEENIGAIWEKMTFWAFLVGEHTGLSDKKVKILLDMIEAFWLIAYLLFPLRPPPIQVQFEEKYRHNLRKIWLFGHVWCKYTLSGKNVKIVLDTIGAFAEKLNPPPPQSQYVPDYREKKSK